MKFISHATIAVVWLLGSGVAVANPSVVHSKHGVTYRGIHRNGIEVFLGVPYGQDTGGANRFKPPRPHILPHGSIIHATSNGPACPQQVGSDPRGITGISEDCLNLNIARPKDTGYKDKLPVMVYIFGGGFWAGSNSDPRSRPDSLVLESVKNGLPVIHVAINHRLGVFGFAKSHALNSEGSENAGMRDQRLALEWIRDNIAQFGGASDKITVYGQSSGGMAIGVQVMAYGAAKPAPFHQVICESQVLEPGITSNFTINAMKALVDNIGCNKTDLHSPAALECLRKSDMGALLNASIATYRDDVNLGDIWLPTVDGDFLPAPPSQLIKEGRVAKVTMAMGWCQDDTTRFVDPKIKTDADTRSYIGDYAPGISTNNLDKILSLYHISEFPENNATGLSGEFYRTGRILRDILMTCQPFYYAKHLNAAGSKVYLYDWNQTIYDPALGVFHGADLPYVFGNLSQFNRSGVNPTPADYTLATRASRSWSTFANLGKFSQDGHDTFKRWEGAFSSPHDIRIFVAGGPTEGMSSIDGSGALPAMSVQKLRDRCAFLNSPNLIKELAY